MQNLPLDGIINRNSHVNSFRKIMHHKLIFKKSVGFARRVDKGEKRCFKDFTTYIVNFEDE